MFIYKLTRRGIEVTSEVVCERHRASNMDMEALSAKEQAAGYRQTFTPYDGDRPCASCDSEEKQEQLKAEDRARRDDELRPTGWREQWNS